MKQLIFCFLGFFFLAVSLEVNAQNVGNDPPEKVFQIECGVLPFVAPEFVELETENVKSLAKPVQNRMVESVGGKPLLAQVLPLDHPPNRFKITAQLPTEETLTFWQKLFEWFKGNWVSAIMGLMAALKVIVNLTPTETDNKIFAWLDSFINSIIPNLKKGGGVHKPPEKV